MLFIIYFYHHSFEPDRDHRSHAINTVSIFHQSFDSKFFVQIFVFGYRIERKFLRRALIFAKMRLLLLFGTCGWPEMGKRARKTKLWFTQNLTEFDWTISLLSLMYWITKHLYETRFFINFYSEFVTTTTFCKLLRLKMTVLWGWPIL